MRAEPPAPAGALLAVTDDLRVGRRLRALADANGLALTEPERGPGGPGEPDPADPAARPPVAAVIDLSRPDALEIVRAWRARWPDTLLAAFLTDPDRDRWVAAQRAGADLVVNRGALIPRLRALLADRSAAAGAGRSRRYPLAEAADAAGRLGLVCRVGESPVGPVAVYQAEGQLHAVADRCPHAGATLSDGEFEGGVVTCPGHGSRFDVRTGERVRGPADAGLPVFPLIQEGGQIFLVTPPER